MMSLSDEFRGQSAHYLEKARITRSLRGGGYFRKLAAGYAVLADNDDWLEGVVPPSSSEARDVIRRED